ncbi:MAG TPA: type II toxin-antitoxin system RelE/ParE family toxin [Deltaproteobacteria bacterium]|nr:type II toxin-antitoxin system RelE/ParE family toxin [Deltaproteobacteria bacterium]
MNWIVQWDKRAFREFEKIDRVWQEKIFRFIVDHIETEDDPRRLGKPLHGKFKGFWKYRIGDYRLVCHIQDEVLTVLILRARHRSSVYNR